MTDSDRSARVLLLVEDNPADAELVLEYLHDPAAPIHYDIFHETRMADAVHRLQHEQVDIVLLDLRLPDSSGSQSVETIHAVADGTPIVVLTGDEDEELALSCVRAGAHDYLLKSEMHAGSLQRSIGYAISRLREAQLRELQQVLEGYRALSSASSQTSVTAALSGIGPLRERLPADFRKMMKTYSEVLESYLNALLLRTDKPRDSMEWCITQLGDRAAGPRDLIDLHVAALEEVLKGKNEERSRSLMIEGRLLALEMMGLLVDFYRTGGRRGQPSGWRS